MSDISLSKAVRTNLLSLQNTATMMAATQDRLATGNKVNSALDNPTNFFTASALNSRAGDLNQLIDNMANGVKTLEAADNGLTSITKTLESMQSTLRQARQDKSFAVDTFEVGKDSTLKVAGGRFGESTDIKLQAPSGGTKASVSFAAAYAEPSIVGSAGNGTIAGAGARAVISYNASHFTATSKMKVDGQEITFDGDGNATDTAAAIQTALGGSGSDYTVTADTVRNSIIIENKDKTLASPKVELGSGITAATYGETSFTYNAAHAGTVTVGGQEISNGGGSFDEFVTALNAKAEDGGYTVIADKATQKITLRNAEPGATAAPTISGLREPLGAKTTFDLTGAAGTASNEIDFTIDSIALNDIVGADAATVGGNLKTAIEGNATLNAKYSVTMDGDNLVLTQKAGGAGKTAAVMTATATGTGTAPTSTTGAFVDGDSTGIAVTRTNGAAGASTKTLDAAAHKFSVNYGGKSVDLNIVGRDATSATPKEDQLKSINDQLKAGGLSDIVATFDADEKLVLTSTNPEAKTLAISGTSNDLFGTKTVSTGAAAVSAYKATNAVDQFVEEINGNAATSKFLRASNDNGKLRIENLSTQELSVDFDKDGANGAAATSHKIAGNSVREGLAKQFNELKDQLNKLSDDASFNGINLLRGDQLTITFNETGNSFMQIKAGDDRGVNSQSLDISDLSAVELDADENIDKLLGDIKLALNEVRSQSSAFGSNLSIVQNRQDFTKNMINTLETGAANLTLADMNAEAANLLALQTRQSLSSSALSMASQADQGVLQLLR
ncbi:MAG TPA: flagellin [Devosia sp.]|jgi:flagellin-like hook-associated protein FlgL|uniref:flagellin N-terminal helical domain-containing protein n=1 Tax=Devosia sp. TaxID=1871048 RepID=UPI002F9289C9